MSVKKTKDMTHEEYQEFLKTIDPDSMGFEGKVEGAEGNEDK